MANTTVIGNGIITITGLDADWYLSQDAPFFKDTGLKLTSITVHPAAANDVAVILDSKTGNPTGAATLFHTKFTDTTDTKIEYMEEKWCWPFIDISAWTIPAPTGAKVIFKFK